LTRPDRPADVFDGAYWKLLTERAGGNEMLPLAAFPMHYYPATDTMKFCRPVQSNLAT
jgi:hypothetical protein